MKKTEEILPTNSSCQRQIATRQIKKGSNITVDNTVRARLFVYAGKMLSADPFAISWQTAAKKKNTIKMSCMGLPCDTVSS